MKKKSSLKSTIAVSLTNYLDAGAIVAGASGLTLWKDYLGLSEAHLGWLNALSANCLGAATGAIIGGFLADKYGRKTIYTYNMLIYMAGVLCILLATSFAQLMAGFLTTGISVGVGVPASWTYISENSEVKNRGRNIGISQMAWGIGPTVILILGTLLAPPTAGAGSEGWLFPVVQAVGAACGASDGSSLNVFSSRIVFASLFVVAFIAWLMQRQLEESKEWIRNEELRMKNEEFATATKETDYHASANSASHASANSSFFILHSSFLKPMLFLAGMYLTWNLVASVMGFFQQHIYETAGGLSNAAANLLSVGQWVVIIATTFVFSMIVDKVNQRWLYFTGVSFAVLAWVLVLTVGITSLAGLLLFTLLWALQAGISVQSFYALWASELFPARYRAAAQGIMFFVVRGLSAAWGLAFVYIYGEHGEGFTRAAWVMLALLVVSLVIGTAGAPDNRGKTLEQITKERYGSTLTIFLAALAALTLTATPAHAQQVLLHAEAQASVADGSTPLWLNANKYGLSSLDKSNGYLRLSAFRHMAPADTAATRRRWDWAAGADVAVAAGYTSTVIVQQAYAELRWLNGLLTVGSKEQPLQLKDQRLSTGSQTLGVNARPVPSARLELPQYWDIPGLAHWLGLKGHIAYGLTTDSRWQKSFTSQRTNYTENVRLHTKAAYLRIGPAGKPFNVEVGAEFGCQYGGESHLFTNGQEQVVQNEAGLKGAWHALVPGGEEAVEKDIVYKNTSGNHVGSYVMRVNYDQPAWGLSLYADHVFDDQSQMFFFSNNSYGQDGRSWQEKGNRYLVFALKDMMLGLELRLKHCRWMDKFVAEYLYTKYQSGPIYHDHSATLLDHISGLDDYYNHSVFAAWQHWGQVMGNPLYRSPIYNDDGRLMVKDNRFTAWHLAATGSPVNGLRYRLMCTWQHGLGTYRQPYTDKKSNVSLLAEAEYAFPEQSKLQGFAVRGAIATDRGGILGDNTGFQLTVAKTISYK